MAPPGGGSGLSTEPRALIWTEVDVIRGLVEIPGGKLHRLTGDGCLAVIGWSPDAHVAAVSDPMRELMQRAGVRWPGFDPAAYEPEGVPPALERLRDLLSRSSLPAPLTITGGPTWVFPRHLARTRTPPAPIIVSTVGGSARARTLDRPANWEPDEWAALVGGRLGPWAMALEGSAPISICHTPAATDNGAEAGVWTREDRRRRGLTAAVTRRWWERERGSGRTLFYSTTRENQASQGVARTLGLTPLGWLWTLR